MNEAAIEQGVAIDHDVPVGEILRQYRVHYGQTLEQVEFALRIRAEQLQALEMGDVSRLPGRVYAIGFVRTYSEFLGLDPNHMVHLFKTQSIGSKPKTELEFPSTSRESQLPSMPLVAGSLGGLVLLLIVWFAFFYQPVHQEDVIPVLEEEVVAEITQAPPIGIEATASEESLLDEEPAPILQPVKPKTGVVLKIEEKSWIEIRDANGKIVISQILNAGDEYTIPEGEGYRLTTGNAGGMSIMVDGQESPKLGRPAQVRRNISLNPDDLI